MAGILRAAGAAALALVVLAPAAAQADRWASPDEPGDVSGTSFSPEPPPCGTYTSVDATDETHTDITSLAVRHTRHSMVVTLWLRGIRSSLEQLVMFHVRSSTGGWWLDFERFRTRDGEWRTRTFLGEEPEWPRPDEIGPCGDFFVVIGGVGCRIGRDVDLARDRIRLSVPRRCLDNPAWVRVAATSQRSRATSGDVPGYEFFVDDWDHGVELSPWMPPFGPRVRATAGADTRATRTAVAAPGARRELVVGRHGIFARR